MNVELFAAYAVLSVVLALTPGPAVLTVFAQGLRHGWRRSVFGTLGVLACNAAYFVLSALGVSAFIAASPRLFAVLKWGGIAFLAWTAVRTLLAKPREDQSVVDRGGRPRALFLQSLVTQLANPWTIFFFASFLAPFVDPHAPWPPAAQVAVYAITGLVLEMPILVGYGIAGAQGARLLGSRAMAWEGRIAGVCLLAAAVWLALR